MKKYCKILLLLVALLLCMACKKEEVKEEIKPFDLKEEYYQKSAIKEIDLDGLNKLIDDKESFVVSVYLPGCSSCAEFRVVLDEFLKENQLTLYTTQIEYAKQTEIGQKIKYAPSCVVFKEGKVVAYLDAASDDDEEYYETSANFKEWLTKYINLK